MGQRRGLGLYGAHCLEAGAPEFTVKTKSVQIIQMAYKGESKLAAHNEISGEPDIPPTPTEDTWRNGLHITRVKYTSTLKHRGQTQAMSR